MMYKIVITPSKKTHTIDDAPFRKEERTLCGMKILDEWQSYKVSIPKTVTCKKCLDVFRFREKSIKKQG